MSRHEIIYDDFEREAEKESVYLQELQNEMMMEWQRECEEEAKRKPAIVLVKKEDSLQKQEDGKQENDCPLPF